MSNKDQIKSPNPVTSIGSMSTSIIITTPKDDDDNSIDDRSDVEHLHVDYNNVGMTNRSGKINADCKNGVAARHQSGNSRLHRKDKISPMTGNDSPSPSAELNPSLLHHTSTSHVSDSLTSISLDSTKSIINKSTTRSEEGVMASLSDVKRSPLDTPIDNISWATRVSPLTRQLLFNATDASSAPFSTISRRSQLTHAFHKPDITSLPRGSSQLEIASFECLGIPSKRSLKFGNDPFNNSQPFGSHRPDLNMFMTGSQGSELNAFSTAASAKIRLSSTLSDKSCDRQRSRTASLNRILSGATTPAIDSSAETCTITNLSTARGRRWNATMILTLSVAPIVALLLQNCINLYFHMHVFQNQEDIKKDILFSTEIGSVMHRTQIERGTTVLFISTQGKDQTVVHNLQKAYNATDNAIDALTKWTPQSTPPHFQTRAMYHNRIKQFRDTLLVDGSLNKTEGETLKFYSDDNSIIERWVSQSIRLSTNGDLWRTLTGYYMLILSKEQAGIERALGGSFFASGSIIFTKSNFVNYLQRKVKGEAFLQQSMDYLKRVVDLLEKNYIGTETEKAITTMRNEILTRTAESDSTKAKQWFANMTQFIDIQKDIQDSLAKDIVVELNSDLDSLEEKVVEATFTIVVSLVLFPSIVCSVYRLTKRIQAYADKLHERTVDLDIERKRSETLLYELLPEQVAQRLLNNEDVPPMSYRAVTVFFSDICGFTYICSKSNPMQVIDMLNSLYRIFDDIIGSYNVYKVETIGDAYMVASGVPVENPTGHAIEMAGVALDMRDNISNLMVNHIPDEKLQLRIGINSGPVVAGVVGHKMPRYCLFGDTVNVASRMESTGLPLQIQITDSTKSELEKMGDFNIQPRGKIDVKGKGMMQTYWLIARHKPPQEPANSTTSL